MVGLLLSNSSVTLWSMELEFAFLFIHIQIELSTFRVFQGVFMLIIVGFKNILSQPETFGNGWHKQINTFVGILNKHISKCAFANFEW